MFSSIDNCQAEQCSFLKKTFPLPFAFLLIVAFVFIVYFYVRSFKNSYYYLVTVRQFFENAKVETKRVLRVIRNLNTRPEYMENFLLVLNSLLFGLGSWVAITGLWLEVPVLIHHLPEGWSLASYLTFAIQLANIAPLIYWFLNRKYSKYCNEVSATNAQLLIGTLASTTLIFYWETKFFFFGDQHSVVLLVCAFLLSIVDCLSSVTFLPFMARFRSVYLTPYLIGEGLSGFLPTILALAQNAEDNYNPPDIYNTPTDLTVEDTTQTAFNNSINLNSSFTLKPDYSSQLNRTIKKIELSLAFGPDLFFVSLLVTILISWCAFFYLQFHQPNHFERRNSLPLPKREKKKTIGQELSKYLLGYDKEARKAEEQRWEQRKQLIINNEKLNRDVKRIVKQNQHLLKENSHVTIVQNNSPAIDAISTASFTAIKSCKPLIKENNQFQSGTELNNVPLNRNRRSRKKWNKDKLEYYYLQFLIFFACTITFGLLPPLQPFSCLPVSHSTLKYTVILSGLSYPVGCAIALFVKCKSTKILTLLTFLSILIAGFIFYCATHSPFLPPFMQNANTTKEEDLLLINNYSDKRLNISDWEVDGYSERDEQTALKKFWMHFNYHQSLIFSIFMISQWVIFNLVLSYVKTMITIILNDKNGQEALFAAGLCSQLGSLLGSFFMFIAVNHLNWFKEK